MLPPLTRRFFLSSQYFFAAVGTVLLIYCGAMTVRARLFQEGESRSFEERRGVSHASWVGQREPSNSAVKRPKPFEGSIVARLTIPDLGITSMVVEGVSHEDLSVALGHIPGTALPGEAGNVVIAGHRDTGFRPLRYIHANEMIKLTTFSEEYRYRIVSTEIVLPTDIRVLYPTSRDTLTLVTCYPFGFVGPAPRRFVVRAERIR